METAGAFLLKTKFYVPPRRLDLVLRSRLFSRMAGTQPHLTLVSARAGAGKTTLVSEWLQQEERRFAWLSLDENDNDPHRFFSHLMEAFHQMEVTIDPAWLAEIGRPELPPVDVVMGKWINAIAASPAPFILVLDDYHVLRDQWIHNTVAFIALHGPPEMHLVLVTRQDPPWPLAQLRARGQLSEIRDDDLRFTPEEAAAFLNEVMRLDLPPSAVATIEERTEGWIAGLQLAAISAQWHKQKDGLDAFIRTFGGTNRFILDYLTEEVLNQQPPEVQDFLIETSILDRMCVDLCDVVCGADRGRDILNHLERSNLFVIPLDDQRHWYRYHHLFAQLLQSVLRLRRSPEQINQLHSRAGQWYQSQNLLVEAMTHSLAAGDFERAAAMMDENTALMLNLFSRNQNPLVLQWIERLPDQVKRNRPWIDIYYANLLALSLQLDGVDDILDDVEKRIDPASPRAAEMLGHIAIVRAYAANLRGNAPEAIALAETAKKQLAGDENRIAQIMVAFVLADTYLALDDMESATQALYDLARFGEKARQVIIIVPALHDLAIVRTIQGQLHQAEALFRQAYQVMEEHDAQDTRVRCSYEFGMADLLREWNQLEAARKHALTGIEVRRRHGAYRVIGDLALMRILQACGDTEGALKALREAEQAVQTYPFQLALWIEFKTARVQHWLLVGDVETAARYASECSGSTEVEQITLAKVMLAQSHPAEAFEPLSRQRGLAESGGRSGRLIEILALQALALDALGRTSEADEALALALSLARPEGYLRTFLDLGQPLIELLRRQVARDGGTGSMGTSQAGGYTRILLEAFRQERQAAEPVPDAAGLVEPLTGRELHVLQLVGEGLSNKEIASKLVVAPSTIKQHLKNICRKLDVHNRTQAVRRAQELKLF